MTLMEWIEKNAAEGANLEEAKKLVEGANLPQSKEDAAKLVEDNQYLKSELDSRVSKSVENATERFKENKLPDILKEEREKIRQELNPEETEEQKRIRELQEKVQSFETEKQKEQRKAQLREKAKELGYDPLDAENYVAFGDKAEEMLEKHSKKFQSTVDTKVNEYIKQKYGGKPPEAPTEKSENAMSRSQFEGLNPDKKMEFMRQVRSGDAEIYDDNE